MSTLNVERISNRILYNSTRGGEINVTFEEAVTRGLASDGGLFVPNTIPQVSAEEQSQLRKETDYRELCYHILSKFINPQYDIPSQSLRNIIYKAYESFEVPEKCIKIRELNLAKKIYLLELFHGPTLAFKDFALQLLGQLFGYFVSSRSRAFLMLGATSGDTGSAAIAGFKGIPKVKCAILFPQNRTSQTQELQMTTIQDVNVQCFAVKDASFDVCQSLVKQVFKLKAQTQDGPQFSAVNSINWARILAQIVYYWAAVFDLQRRGIVSRFDVCVPTGNFGNILAAFYAKKMGAPLNRLIIASNENDILTRFSKSGKYELKEVIPTTSPSMDIQVSSNFERALLDFVGGENFEAVAKMYSRPLNVKGEAFEVGAQTLSTMAKDFTALSANEEEVQKAILECFEQIIIDPHTAVGIACIKKYLNQSHEELPIICASTAHFGKFGEAVSQALSRPVSIPSSLKVLQDKPQRVKVVSADLNEVLYALDQFANSA